MSKKQKIKKEKTERVSHNSTIVCPPDKAGRSKKIIISGYVCRALLAFFAVFGLVFFSIDALRLEYQDIIISGKFIALACFAATALVVLAVTSKIGLGVSLAATVGGVIYMVVSGFDLIKSILTVKNVIFTRLYNIGYYTLSKYMSDLTYTEARDVTYYMKGAVVLLAIVMALIFVLCTVRRVRVALPAVVSTAILVAVFVYNLSSSNWGVTLIIASFSGLLIMSAYDRIFLAKKTVSSDVAGDILFEPEDRPTVPEGVLTGKAARLARREKRREYRELKRKHKEEQTQITVDEELTMYFGGSVKKEKKRFGLSKEEKRAEREERRRVDRAVRAVKNYDRDIRDSRAAQGGFAGIGVFLIVTVMLLLPTLTVKGKFTTIAVIDERMEYYREYVTAWLMGDDPILDELGYENDKKNFEAHSTAITPRYYNGTKIFDVKTALDYNVYLRGWIGVDYGDSAWLATEKSDVEKYRQLFGTYLDPTETMFMNFYSTMNPDILKDMDYSTKYNLNTRYGFATEQVNISRGESEDTLVYLPAFLRMSADLRTRRADGYGLFEYESDAVFEDATFVNYFDGLYTGRGFADEIAYGAVANVTTMKTASWYETVAAYIADYNSGYVSAQEEIEEYAKRKLKGKSASLDTVAAAIFSEEPEDLISVENDEIIITIRVQYEKGVGVYNYDADTNELISKNVTDLVIEKEWDLNTGEEIEKTAFFVAPDLPLDIAYRVLFTDEQKRSLAYNYYYQYIYSDFVYDTYLDKAEKGVVSDTLAKILAEKDFINSELASAAFSADPETYEQRHKLILAIVDYMKENYTYSLEASMPEGVSVDSVEYFLETSREGYCVQYASALALMLRELGIPARYVEGYVACDFAKSYGTGSRYISYVRDYNEHSWVEVWYDGSGWVQYEATPVYYNDMYVRADGESSGSVERPWYEYLEDEEYTEEQSLLDEISGKIIYAEARIELMREDMAGLLFGVSDIKKSLDSIENVIDGFAESLEFQRDYYNSVKDTTEYNSREYIPVLKSMSQRIDDTTSEALANQEVRVEGAIRLNRIIRVAIIVLAVVVALTVWLIALHKAAKRAEKARAAEADAVISGKLEESVKRETAKRMSENIMELLAACRLEPKPGEFRDEYAERLSTEFASHAIDEVEEGGHAKSQPEIDFRILMSAIAAEEFGYGMSDEELVATAKAYKSLRTIVDKRIKGTRRIYYHLIKRRI